MGSQLTYKTRKIIPIARMPLREKRDNFSGHAVSPVSLIINDNSTYPKNTAFVDSYPISLDGGI
jgi:hypothetical protein